jgi:alcohol dehydrogenase class IV
MWYFRSPEIVFGDDALARLEELRGRQACIVTDANLQRLGIVARVQQRLSVAGIPSAVFAEVEPDPCLQTVRAAARVMTDCQPDWIIGLGGGSCLDVAKAAWLLYERPETDLASISPFENFGLRAKARLIAIPTTSGTGSEATWAVVLTSTEDHCKLALGARDLLPDIAILDPALTAALPPAITADTGLDALTHAIEGYSSTWHNDFSDGLCLQAARLILTYLPRAFADGGDALARERMHNAAAIAGLGFGNSMAGLAHAMGHALGAACHTPHGRAVGLFLPYTIEFIANGGSAGRYADLSYGLRLPAADEAEAVHSLLAAIGGLRQQLGAPATLAELGLSRAEFVDHLPRLLADAEADADMVASPRIPDRAQLEHLFECAYSGGPVTQ